MILEAPTLLKFFAGKWSEAPDDENQDFSFSLELKAHRLALVLRALLTVPRECAHLCNDVVLRRC